MEHGYVYAKANKYDNTLSAAAAKSQRVVVGRRASSPDGCIVERSLLMSAANDRILSTES
jgi:hypothetical protein